MKTIWKYPLPVNDDVTIAMRAGAEVLDVQVQHGMLQLWAMVDSLNPIESRRFRVIGTGHPIRDAEQLTHIATVQLHGGELVFHVFESKATRNSNEPESAA